MISASARPDEQPAARQLSGFHDHPGQVRQSAGALMTTPAITIHPNATIQGAARLMNTHHVRRLPVVDSKGTLVGIVSRRDLLSVFFRPDADIARDVRQMLQEFPLIDPQDVTVTVRDGVVILSGPIESTSRPQQDLISVALRLI
jgi:CBS domain-containing protein